MNAWSVIGIATSEGSCGHERESRPIQVIWAGNVNRTVISPTCCKRSIGTASIERREVAALAPARRWPDHRRGQQRLCAGFRDFDLQALVSPPGLFFWCNPNALG